MRLCADWILRRWAGLGSTLCQQTKHGLQPTSEATISANWKAAVCQELVELS